MGTLQERILEWVAFPFSKGSSQPRMEPRSPALQVDSLPAEPQGKPKITGVGTFSLLQGIFPSQESIWGLLHCREANYPLSHGGSLINWVKQAKFCDFKVSCPLINTSLGSPHSSVGKNLPAMQETAV